MSSEELKSDTLTAEQRARVAALNEARSVLNALGPFGIVGSVSAGELVVVASWILDGVSSALLEIEDTDDERLNGADDSETMTGYDDDEPRGELAVEGV